VIRLIVLLAIALVMLWWLTRKPLFAYDKRNPYRRYCRRCGQQQDAFTWVGGKHTFWQAQFRIEDDTCPCHNHCRDTNGW